MLYIRATSQPRAIRVWIHNTQRPLFEKLLKIESNTVIKVPCGTGPVDLHLRFAAVQAIDYTVFIRGNDLSDGLRMADWKAIIIKALREVGLEPESILDDQYIYSRMVVRFEQGFIPHLNASAFDAVTSVYKVDCGVGELCFHPHASYDQDPPPPAGWRSLLSQLQGLGQGHPFPLRNVRPGFLQGLHSYSPRERLARAASCR
jgi:hypothetical protein